MGPGLKLLTSFNVHEKASSKASKPTVDPAAQQGLMLAIAGVLGEQLQQLPVQSSACSAPDRPSYAQVLAIVKAKVQRWRQMELAGNEQCVEVQSESSDSCVFLKPESLDNLQWKGTAACVVHSNSLALSGTRLRLCHLSDTAGGWADAKPSYSLGSAKGGMR